MFFIDTFAIPAARVLAYRSTLRATGHRPRSVSTKTIRLPGPRDFLASFVLLAACSDPSVVPSDVEDAGPACKLAFLGDPSAAALLEPIVLGVDGVSDPLLDGDMVPLTFPPQGGRVIFAGVRATNIDACAVRLTGSLRDLETGQLRLDARTINLAGGTEEWGSSVDEDISTFANIPVCPNQWSATDVFEHSYELKLTVEDGDGRTAKSVLTVVPACAEPEHEAECLCICAEDYVLGQRCNQR